MRAYALRAQCEPRRVTHCVCDAYVRRVRCDCSTVASQELKTAPSASGSDPVFPTVLGVELRMRLRRATEGAPPSERCVSCAQTLRSVCADLERAQTFIAAERSRCRLPGDCWSLASARFASRLSSKSQWQLHRATVQCECSVWRRGGALRKWAGRAAKGGLNG